ncbi:uncharacterized protein LOC121998541 isoform X2 [Zingiber officinale]|uniref:uncharacterized protein LOC121998541 isoform X2 n=1 Tax=Zingiber officinale TaxID=94328 RepID=UPI001C4C8BDB|nr:uncharacterized protein LOC121998541 isoform X2 [Zingiber officinale]
MGTRQVYEEKLRNGNLQHDPTMSPGLGSARCPRCLSLINPNPEKGGWAITSVLHDAASVAGSGAGGLLSAVHSMNSGIPFIQKHVKGPKWLQFSVGLTCFRRSVSSVCHHTMPLRVPLAMQYRELQIILKNLIYPSVQEKAS